MKKSMFCVCALGIFLVVASLIGVLFISSVTTGQLITTTLAAVGFGLIYFALAWDIWHHAFGKEKEWK